MKLILHQFRHECLHHRWLILAFLVALLINAAIALELVAPIHHSFEVNQIHKRIRSSASITLITLFILLILAPIFADSPARLDRHLTTRPIPPQKLFGGKAFFILVTLILPLVLTDFSIVILYGHSPILASQIAFDKLILLIPLALLAASFASQFHNPLSCFLSALAIVLCLCFGYLIFSDLPDYIGYSFFSVKGDTLPTIDSLWLGSFAPILILTIATYFFYQKKPSFKQRLALQAGGFTLALLLVTALSHIEFNLPTKEQKNLTALVLNPDHPPRLSKKTTNNDNYLIKDLEVIHAPNILSQISSLYPQATYRQHFKNLRIYDGSKTKYKSFAKSFEIPAFDAVEHSTLSLSQGLHNTLVKGFPNLRAIIPNNRMTTLTGIRLPDSVSPPPYLKKHEKTRSEGTVQMSIGEWEIKANLPLNSKERPHENGFQLINSSYSLSKFPYIEDNQLLKIDLIQSQVKGTLLKEQNLGRFKNLYIGLYFPSLELIEFGKEKGTDKKHNKGLNAASRRRITTYFSLPRKSSLTKSLLQEARLIVLGIQPLAHIDIPYSDQPISKLPRKKALVNNLKIPEKVYRNTGQLTLWMRENPRNPQATDDEVYQEIQALIFLTESTHYWPKDDGPVVKRLASYVPQHLDLLIDYLEVYYLLPSRSQLILKAITLGISPEQKDTLIDAAIELPTLMNVLTKRGWLKEGEEVFRHHLTSASYTQRTALLALLSLNHPENDIAILEYFLKKPSRHVYLLIKKVPRLRQALSEHVDEIWPDRIFAFNHKKLPPSLEISLTQGNPKALEDLFYIVQMIVREPHQYQLLYSQIRVFFHLPQALISNKPEPTKSYPLLPQELYSWLLKHQPDDFVFDPIRELFVLKN